MRFSGPAGFMAGSIFAVALTGTTVASAAAAHVLTLGASNTASKTTTLKAGSHTALSLVSNGVAALKVSNTKKVARLDSDLLDGLDSTAFARTTGQTGEIDVAGTAVDVNNDGTPDAVGAEADCPAGTLVTGGGSSNFTTTGVTLVDGPTQGGWLAVSTFDSTQDQASDFTTKVVCYNPRGAVPGATSLKSAHVTLRQAARAAVNRR